MRFFTKDITILCAYKGSGLRCQPTIKARVTDDGTLAYHKTHTEIWGKGKNLTLGGGSPDHWSVTHVASGYCIHEIEGNEARIKEWIAILAGLTDWSREFPDRSLADQAWEKFENPIIQVEMF